MFMDGVEVSLILSPINMIIFGPNIWLLGFEEQIWL
jgi:hypothetical protein